MKSALNFPLERDVRIGLEATMRGRSHCQTSPMWKSGSTS